MNDDEKFFAWLDGELEPAEAAEVEARVAADPELRRLAEQHRALGNQLRSAFDPVAASPIPERLQAALRPSAQVIDFAAAKRARSMPALAQWTAIAATLAIGIFVGARVPQGTDAPVEVQGGKLYAAAAVNQALDRQLASAPSGDVRIGVTYRDQSGAICRTFTAAAASGLACRSGGRWQMKGLFAAPEGQSSSYRMAAGMDPNLAALVGSTMAGDPFDAATEKTARDKGWR
jgi:anti-sigma factor RsiW